MTPPWKFRKHQFRFESGQSSSEKYPFRIVPPFLLIGGIDLRLQPSRPSVRPRPDGPFLFSVPRSRGNGVEWTSRTTFSSEIFVFIKLLFLERPEDRLHGETSHEDLRVRAALGPTRHEGPRGPFRSIGTPRRRSRSPTSRFPPRHRPSPTSHSRPDDDPGPTASLFVASLGGGEDT